MKIIDKIDDSFGTGERVIHVVELASNTFVDVMVINDEIHSGNYPYIMDFDGSQPYTKTDDGYKGVDYQFDSSEVLDFVCNYAEIEITAVKD